MSLSQWSRKVVIILSLVLALTFATASPGLTQIGKTTTVAVVRGGVDYKQFERAKPATKQDFGGLGCPDHRGADSGGFCT